LAFVLLWNPALAALATSKLTKDLCWHVSCSETLLGWMMQAVYQKTCNLFFRKSVKSAVTSEQKQLDMAKSRLQKLDQAWSITATIELLNMNCSAESYLHADLLIVPMLRPCCNVIPVSFIWDDITWACLVLLS
jgi:hypothetical protein